MTRPATHARDLVMTQAEPAPPPAENVPHPEPHTGPAPRADADLIHEVRALAERVGGLAKLRDLIDELLTLPR